jgi:hypothetical protein
MPTWGMMTELADGLTAWALVNVLFASVFLFGGWRREQFVRASRSPATAAGKLTNR